MKQKIQRLIVIYRRIKLYRIFRKYATQSLHQRQLQDKSKIEGAYLLLKRYKNRLKNYDAALERITSLKADKSSLEKLEEQTKPERAVSVFNDMKILFDSTTL